MTNIPVSIAKLAAEEDHSKRRKGLASAYGGSIGLYNVNSRGLVTGRESLTHVTDAKNVESILNNGILSERALDPDNLTSKLGLPKDQMKGKVYMGRGMATPYGVKAGLIQNGVSSNPEILKAKVPTWMMNEVDNPELMGAKNFKEYKKALFKRAPMAALKSDVELRSIYKILSRGGTAVIEGDISPMYIKGSKHYRGAGMKEIMGYAKAKPLRFAGGALLTLGSAGAIGYGAKEIIRKGSTEQ